MSFRAKGFWWGWEKREGASGPGHLVLFTNTVGAWGNWGKQKKVVRRGGVRVGMSGESGERFWVVWHAALFACTNWQSHGCCPTSAGRIVLLVGQGLEVGYGMLVK